MYLLTDCCHVLLSSDLELCSKSSLNCGMVASEFNPVAPPSDCHFDFKVATDCSYNLVKSLAPATPEKLEDIFVSMRAHLLRIIEEEIRLLDRNDDNS